MDEQRQQKESRRDEAGKPCATTGGNAEAWRDSVEEVVRFFGRNLSRS